MNHFRPLHLLEAEIGELFAAVEAAPDPTQPFAKLKAAINELTTRSRELQRDWHQQRSTISHQAASLAEAEIDAFLGERAPAQSEPCTRQSVQFPDVLTVDTAPNCLFLRLSYGFVNLLHITELNLDAKMLYTVQGCRNLSDADTLLLKWHLSLYSPNKYQFRDGQGKAVDDPQQ